jgi:hypothetical protein
VEKYGKGWETWELFLTVSQLIDWKSYRACGPYIGIRARVSTAHFIGVERDELKFRAKNRITMLTIMFDARFAPVCDGFILRISIRALIAPIACIVEIYMAN